MPDMKFIPDVEPPTIACGTVDFLIDHLVLSGDELVAAKSLNDEYIRIFAMTLHTFTNPINVISALSLRAVNNETSVKDLVRDDDGGGGGDVLGVVLGP